MRVLMGMVIAGLIFVVLPGTWQARVIGWFEGLWTWIPL